MSVVAEQLESLVRLRWSRDVIADEDGVFIASVPELEGCFASGDTVEEALAALDIVLREWLEIALEEGQTIPNPRQQTLDEHSGRFTVRVPRSLHRLLSERAAAEGSSLNQLVSTILARSAGEDKPIHSAVPEVHEDIAADAVRSGQESLGALKGIATYVRDRGDLNLACLLFGIASDRVANVEGAEAASREFGAAAALAKRHSRTRLAEALWRESLRRDPTNLRSSSSLGQLLHHQGRYEEAIALLEPASQVDNYALLFLGWSLLLRGKGTDDTASIRRGGMSVKRALEKWTYQNRDNTQREAWLRHVRRLSRAGAEWEDTVRELIAFTNANAFWAPISEDDVVSESEDPVTSASDAAVA